MQSVKSVTHAQLPISSPPVISDFFLRSGLGPRLRAPTSGGHGMTLKTLKSARCDQKLH